MKFFVKLVVCLAFWQFLSVASYSQTKEYMLKASFLEKFARFSEWPASTKMDTFKIKLIGTSYFNGALEKMYSSFKIKNKPVSIDYVSSIYDLDNCHILFISASENESLLQILEVISERPILSVGETKGYGTKGVIINFFNTREGTIHFEINKNKLAATGIKMDIMLLDFAKLIK